MSNKIMNKSCGTLGSMLWQFPARAEPLILNTTLCHLRFDTGFGFRLFTIGTLVGVYLPINVL